MDNIKSQEVTFIHIRRCHICSEITEVENDKIDRCVSCGKYLAPFVFCNDPSDNIKQLLKPEYPPISGISLYW